MKGNLDAGKLDRPAVLLALYPAGEGGWEWREERQLWVQAEFRQGVNIFAKYGLGARDTRLVLRRQAISLHNAIRLAGEHILLTAVTERNRNLLEVRGAVCQVSRLEAVLCGLAGRDGLNRPVLARKPPFPFPGVLTELYYRNLPEELYRTEIQGRVLVTPKSDHLAAGYLVREGGEPAWVVRKVLDLDPYKNEYIIEKQEDV